MNGLLSITKSSSYSLDSREEASSEVAPLPVFVDLVDLWAQIWLLEYWDVRLIVQEDPLLGQGLWRSECCAHDERKGEEGTVVACCLGDRIIFQMMVSICRESE